MMRTEELGCRCGHRMMMCHRANARQWCGAVEFSDPAMEAALREILKIARDMWQNFEEASLEEYGDIASIAENALKPIDAAARLMGNETRPQSNDR